MAALLLNNSRGSNITPDIKTIYQSVSEIKIARIYHRQTKAFRHDSRHSLWNRRCIEKSLTPLRKYSIMNVEKTFTCKHHQYVPVKMSRTDISWKTVTHLEKYWNMTYPITFWYVSSYMQISKICLLPFSY